MARRPDSAQIEAALRGEGLIFQWKDHRKWKLRLAFFLLVSLSLHLSCFYLFQVVYPPTERSLPQSAQITILNPRDSATLAVMNQIEDRLAVIDSSTRREMPGMSIEKHAVKFKPFYSEYEMQLKSPPALFEKTPVPDLYPPGEAVLPETHFRAGTPDIAPEWTPHPFVKVRGKELGTRDFVAPISWGEDLERFAETDGNRASFMIAVNAAGRVVHCLLSEGEETGVAQLVQRKVRGLLFAPSPGAGLQWGWVDLSW